MTFRRLLILFAVFLTVGIILPLWDKRTSSGSRPLDSATSASIMSARTSNLGKTTVQSNPPVARAVPIGSVANVQNKEQQAHEGLASLNDEDIVFYGRLEDQFGNPISSATINVEVPFNNGQSVGVRRGSVTTDTSGVFTVKGYRGKSLSLLPMQKGYALASLNAGGIYSRLWPESQRVHPDPDKPIVIKMWKLQGAEPLTPIDFDYKTPYTMNPLCFDLIAGSMLPAGGDIRVTVNRPVGVISQQHPQNWSVRLEVIDGGVIMTDGKQFGITYAAPSDGYTSSELVASDNGSEMAHRAFFLKSRNGQVYAKIRFSFRINRLPDSLMYIEFKGIANTNNSRNWEGDPNTMATAR